MCQASIVDQSLPFSSASMASASALAAAKSFVSAEGDAARVMPHRLDIGWRAGRPRQRQHRLRLAILRPGEIGRRLHRLGDRDGGGDLHAEPPVQLVGRGQRHVALAQHLRRDQREMDVVRIVAERIDALRAGLGEIGFVGLLRRLVGVERIEVAADAVVDVARHVNDVAGARHQRREPVGIGLRPLGPVRRLDEMDVEVDGADMGGAAREHRLEPLQDAGGPPLRLVAAGLPVVPGLRVHRRLGRERGDVVVVGKLVGDGRHRVGIGGVERGAVLRRGFA